MFSVQMHFPTYDIVIYYFTIRFWARYFYEITRSHHRNGKLTRNLIISIKLESNTKFVTLLAY